MSCTKECKNIKFIHMTRKIRKFLDENNYNYLELDLETEGDYSPRDSEWNYSDILHFPHVHKSFNQSILNVSKTTNTSIFLQKLPFIVIPNIIYQEHSEQKYHEAVASTLTLVISIIVEHDEKNGRALTKTNYRFYYNNLFQKIFAYVARYFTKKNYKNVISEDEPLRVQRGKLRKKNNILFLNDNNEVIGPLETNNKYDDNVVFKTDYIFEDNLTLNKKDSFLELDEINIRCQINDDRLVLTPMVCPHEGAPIPNFDKNTVCPWHGRKLKEIISIDLNSNDKEYSFNYLGLNFLLNLKLNSEDEIKISLKSI